MPERPSREPGRDTARGFDPSMMPAFAFVPWAPAMARGAEINSNMHEGLAALSREWQDFAGRRLKEDLGLLHHLATSMSPEQIWSAYAQFWQNATRDYSQEYVAIAKLTGDLIDTNMSAMRHGVEEAVAEVQPRARAA